MSLSRSADVCQWDKLPTSARRASQTAPRAVSHIAQQKSRLSTASRLCMYVAILVAVLGLFSQISRIAYIMEQGKAIAALRAQIQDLSVEGQYLSIELSTRQSIDRVRDEATGRLGMVYPQEGQVRVVTRDALQYAGIAVTGSDGQVDVAQGEVSG